MTMKAAWLTDIHLEFLDTVDISRFCRRLRESSPDIILISGDIAQANSIENHLSKLACEVMLPIYFVLGNHDFYHGSILDVRTRIRDLSSQTNGLYWLSNGGVVRLTQRTCLIGHDGWGDGRHGDFHGSSVSLNDFILIEELAGLNREDLLIRLKNLGNEAANHFQTALQRVPHEVEHIVVLTHVPPFLESSWHEGNYCDDEWLPFFCCQAAGHVLVDFMSRHPNRRMTVLCGHTHGGGTSEILPNLLTVTGPSQYGNPVIQKIYNWK
jgi:Icc protein